MTLAQSIDSPDEGFWYIVWYIGTIAVLGLGVASYEGWKNLRERKSLRKHPDKRWPTAKVVRSSRGAWDWSCWYCKEGSIGFATREAANWSAEQHTDHVERLNELSP